MLKRYSTGRFNNDAFANALRCLSHPFSLFGIGLLVVNDHWLKSTYPSWLTGKLSDFAGLFFFPFLLIVLLASILAHLKWRGTNIAALGFGITAIWFALAKATDAGNQLTTNLITILLGGRVQIVRDPSDLIALASLVPAWMLWCRVERMVEIPPRRVCIALAIAMFATVATIEPDSPSAARLIAQDNAIYIRSTSIHPSQQKFARSTDGAQTWQEVNEGPAALKTDAELPVVVCELDNLQNCYRIGNEDKVEQSRDGGSTWEIAFQISPERRVYMERVAYGNVLAVSKRFDRNPRDLLIANRDGENIVVVAWGNEGLAIRNPKGTWQRVGVLGADPTPTDGFNLLFPESDIWLLSGISTLFSMTFFCTLLFKSSRVVLPRRSLVLLAAGAVGLSLIDVVWAVIGFRLNIPLFVAVLALHMLPLEFAADPSALVLVAILLILDFVFIALFVVLFRTWRTLTREVQPSRIIARARRATVLAAVGIFPVGICPLILWSLNVIADYRVGFSLAIAIPVVSVIIGMRFIYLESKRARVL